MDHLVQDIAAAAGGPIEQLLHVLRMPEGSSSFTLKFYTKETFMDFHRLLLGCLVLYANCLHRLRNLIAKQRTEQTTKTKTLLLNIPTGTRDIRIITCFDLLESYN